MLLKQEEIARMALGAGVSDKAYLYKAYLITFLYCKSIIYSFPLAAYCIVDLLTGVDYLRLY